MRSSFLSVLLVLVSFNLFGQVMLKSLPAKVKGDIERSREVTTMNCSYENGELVFGDFVMGATENLFNNGSIVKSTIYSKEGFFEEDIIAVIEYAYNDRGQLTAVTQYSYSRWGKGPNKRKLQSVTELYYVDNKLAYELVLDEDRILKQHLRYNIEKQERNPMHFECTDVKTGTLYSVLLDGDQPVKQFILENGMLIYETYHRKLEKDVILIDYKSKNGENTESKVFEIKTMTRDDFGNPTLEISGVHNLKDKLTVTKREFFNQVHVVDEIDTPSLDGKWQNKREDIRITISGSESKNGELTVQLLEVSDSDSPVMAVWYNDIIDFSGKVKNYKFQKDSKNYKLTIYARSELELTYKMQNDILILTDQFDDELRLKRIK